MNDMATIIFDLDGTLIDTAPDLLATLEHVLAKREMSAPPRDKMRPMISRGARAMLARSFELAGRPAPPELLDEMLAEFLDHYSANIAVSSRPFPGLLALLEQYRQEGHLMGICTNKREAMSRRLIGELGLDHFFRAVMGIDSLPWSKPDPRHLLETIRAAGGSPQGTVMIGDSESDILAAKAAKVPVIALDFGYSVEPVENLNPDAIISHYDQLPQAIEPFISRPLPASR
jgi:phosphoglycolate phosphatase